MEYPPCLNPQCHSHGQSHPNCRCYGAAEGGMVERYCDKDQAHKPDCQYFDDGGMAINSGNPAGLPLSDDQAAVGESQYGGLANEAATTVLGAGNTLTGGLLQPGVQKLATALGDDPHSLEKLRAQNPKAYALGQVGGLLSGEGAVAGASKLTEGLSLAPKLAIENALFTLGDEVSKSVNASPDSVQTALLHTGLSGVLGAAGGKILGKASDLWQTTVGKTADEFVAGLSDKLGEASEEAATLKPKLVQGPFPNFHPAPGTPLFEETTPATAPEAPAANPGSKAADFIIKRINRTLTEGLSSGAGAAMGRLSGIPMGGYLGAMLGRTALKPLISSVLPSIIKPLLRSEASGAGLKAAFDTIQAIAKGDSMLNKAAQAVFEVGSSNLDLDPDKARLAKLSEQVDTLQNHPEAMMNVGGDLGHYMPQHQTALAATAQNAINYIAAQKPKSIQAAPLDRAIEPSQDQMHAYGRTLAIAEQPLVIMQYVKSGTLKPKDVQDVHTLYPALVPRMIQRINNNMIEHISKGKQVPYSTRRGLSMLMGQPLDSSMTPSAMMAAQATFIPPTPPTMPQASKSGKGSLPKGSKIAENAQTPEESRIKALAKA